MKSSNWLKIRSERGILIHSALQGLNTVRQHMKDRNLMWFYSLDKHYFLWKIIGTADFFSTIQRRLSRYKKIGYNMDILRQTACVVHPIMVDSILCPSLIARRWVGAQTKWRLPSKSVSDGWCLTINVCGWAYRSPVCGFLVFWLQMAIELFALSSRKHASIILTPLNPTFIQ